jgi:hypothetical protein
MRLVLSDLIFVSQFSKAVIQQQVFLGFFVIVWPTWVLLMFFCFFYFVGKVIFTGGI